MKQLNTVGNGTRNILSVSGSRTSAVAATLFYHHIEVNMITTSRLTIILLMATSLFVAGCSGKDDSVKLTKLPGFYHLSYIPEDTTYAYMALAPLDEDVLEKLEEPYEEMLGAYSDLMIAIANDEIDDESATRHPFLHALRHEFKEGVSLESFRKLGLDSKSTGVIFGHGVLPVLRLRMNDTDKFKAFVERIEKRAEQALPQLPVDGMTVWHLDQDEMRIVFGVNDDDFVAAMMPVGSSTAVVEQLLGVQKPVKSLGESTLVQDIMKSKSYLPQGLGFVDSGQIMNRVVNPPQGVDQAIAEQFGVQNMAETISAVCKQELQTLVSVVPRLLVGVTRFDSDGISTEMLVDVQSDVAAQLSRFTAPVPGLGERAGLFSMGASFNIGEMQKFALERIRSLQKDPFECEFLQVDPAELDEALATISNPAAGMVQMLQGFNLVIDDVDKDAVVKLINDGANNNMNPGLMIEFFQQHLGVHAVVAAKSTEALVSMASMMMPQMAALEIEPNGPPVSVSNFLPLPLPVDILAAMSDEAFAFAIGKDAEAALKSSLAKPSEKRPPLLSYSIDGQQYMKLLNAVLESPEVAAAMNDDMKANLSAAQSRRLIRAFYGLNGDVTMNVRMRDDGIAVE
ncbi:MAG: hypothetical protein HKN70_13910, partial [Gammaproteobacteria bacterium]|nr:hypothetical protein [Gammaproteobacteria bacterium]